VNLDVAVGATRILRVLVVRWTSGFVGADAVVHTVARQTQLVHASELQQSRVGRAMRRVTCRATFGFERRVFVNKRPLLVGMALYAGGVGAGGQSCLLEFETAVGVVTIAALHRSFEHLVVEGLVEVGLNFVVTTYAELRLSGLEQEAS